MKSALLSFFALLFSFQIFGQDFAPLGALWFYGESFFEWQMIDIDYLSLTSEKDTSIQNVICHKISKRHMLMCSNRPKYEFLVSRNDSVFFFDEAFNDFQLLYDFNAKKNESWIIKVKNENQKTDTVLVTVDSISTIRLNETDLKKLYVTYAKNNEYYPQPSIIIEKFGDLNYMFNWYPWTSSMACDGNISQGLRCYQDNEFGFYSTGIASSCDYVHFWTNISTQESEPDITIYPNPTTGIIDIYLGNNSKSIVVLTDILGKPILQKDFNNSTQLDIGIFQKGLYLLTIKQINNTVFIRKIMKY